MPGGRPSSAFPAYPRWTTARFFTFLRSALRAASNKWPAKYEAMNSFRIPYTGRETGRGKKRKWSFVCQSCKGEFKSTEGQLDHIVPVGSLKSWEDLPGFCERLFCSPDGFQWLCHECHARVTKEENGIRRMYPYEESSYRNMISRCNNPNATGYQYYGGKGVTVCSRWEKSFYNFLEDMGERPEGCSLDRIDVNGNYEPGNCRWAAAKEQARNTTTNIFLEHEGIKWTIAEWAEALGIKQDTITHRLLRGWSVAESLEFEGGIRPNIIEIGGEQYCGSLSLEDIKYIEKSLSEGGSTTCIGKELGIGCSQVSRLATGFGFKKKEVWKDVEQQAVDLYREGMSQKEISKKLGKSRSTISNYLKETRKMEKEEYERMMGEE